MAVGTNRYKLILTIIFTLLFMSCKQTETPAEISGVGAEIKFYKNESITVESAVLDGDTITAKIKAKFENYKLSDFYEIYVSVFEYNGERANLDVEKTKALNDEVDIFDDSFVSDTFCLAFTGNSIAEGKHYCINFTVEENEDTSYTIPIFLF